MDYFLLYRGEIIRFLGNCRTVAWRAVSTTFFTGKETVTDLRTWPEKGLNRFYEWVMSRSTVAERSLITPARGLGTVKPDKAGRILELLSNVSAVMSDNSH